MNRMRTTTLAALTAGVLAFTTAACGGSPGSGDDTLVYWSMWEEKEPQAEVLKSAIARFEKQSGTEVDVVWQGRKVLQKVAPALRSGEVPDLVDHDHNSLRSTLAEPGQARDLSAVYKANVPGEGKTVAAVGPGRYRELTTHDGKPYMLPYEVFAQALWYDGSKFPKLADKQPETWDAFLKLLDERKKEGRAPLALDGDIGFYNSLWTVHLLERALGPGTVNKIAADKSGDAWRDTKVVNALRRVEDLARGGYFAEGAFGSKWPAMQERWAAGDSDFLLMGSWIPSETRNSAASGFTYRSMPFPTVAGGDDSVHTGAIGFAVPTAAEHPEAAEKFLAFMMKRENIEGFSTKALNLVPRPDVEAPEQLAGLAEALKERKITPAYDGIDADYPNYPTEVFEPAGNALLAGKITADQFIQQVADKQAAYWKKH
ncbi:ABC transporter substrate-binding protein [Streptomyces luteolus]|uniref:ABC transporter substrate-binding protein n=1 Tax=Streptomyces luteolus TaxID=3043615 RepID=A0ABT6ST04_9ACTN|nr:ABC transporter substrate-binding protein [Streptomyces sp. B-S-A12]MDI3418739.1 ABC transporter substrate-binding protein [Streptomyces sp. B-S-A12]